MLMRTLIALASLAAVTMSASAQAPDKLKVAISQRGFWDSSFLEFAQKEGFLKEANLDVEFFYTEGGGQTLQAFGFAGGFKNRLHVGMMTIVRRVGKHIRLASSW